MKATRAEYVEDLKAVEDALVRFLHKHARSAVQDLEVLYAVESVLENGEVETEYTDRYAALADLVAGGYEISDSVDDYRTDLVYEEVREAMEERGLIVWE